MPICPPMAAAVPGIRTKGAVEPDSSGTVMDEAGGRPWRTEDERLAGGRLRVQGEKWTAEELKHFSLSQVVVLTHRGSKKIEKLD